MAIRVTKAAIKKTGQRMVRHMEKSNSEGKTFMAAVSDYGLTEIMDTLKDMGVPCALLGRDAKGLYTGVVIAGQTFRVGGGGSAKGAQR